MPESQMS